MGNRCGKGGRYGGVDASSAVSGPSRAIRPLSSVLKDACPWVRWLNRDELVRLADPSIGARVPHTAVNNIRQALQSGPVLFSIPADGVAEALSCANPKCLRRSLRPLHRPVATCSWLQCAALPVVRVRRTELDMPELPWRAPARGACRGDRNG